MSRAYKATIAVMLASCAWGWSIPFALGQSGTRQPSYAPRPSRSYAPARPQTGSGTRPSPPVERSDQRAPLAFNGHCVVCLVDGKQWSMGSPEHSVAFDGREYRFPGDAERDKFLGNPDRYVPALNGNSVVAYATSGTLVPGNPRFGAIYRERVYLFQDEREKAEFLANSSGYADADLAYRGASAVSFVDHRRNVAGSPEFAARHQGFRYLFASEQEREKFLRDPSRYAQRTSAAR